MKGRVLCTGLLCLAGCSPTSAPEPEVSVEEVTGPTWFTDVAAASGIDFVHDAGQRGERFLFPEIACGGGGLFDADGDGLLDVYLVQSGELPEGAAERPPNRLFRNRGDGTFEDATESSGTGDRGYGMGCAVGDYDGDGDTDLYVTNYGANALYRNDGEGAFTNVADAAGVDCSGWSTSACFLDADGDSDLDLFVANNVRWSESVEMDCFADDGRPDYCGPSNYNAPAADVLYRNDGDGTFTDVSERAGIAVAFGNGLGVVAGDFDNDGHQDVYVANDGMPNQLWLGRGSMKFEEEGLFAGVAVNDVGAAEAGMGVCSEDLEDDGDLDLYVVHLRQETNTFYRNQGGTFVDATARVGLSAGSMPMTGFGVGLFDFDHDGWLDVYVANGRVKLGARSLTDDPYAEPDTLHRGTEGARFHAVSPVGGVVPGEPKTGRAAAFGDIDNDGDIDVLVVNRNAAPSLLRNDRGVDGNWILFRVLETGGGDALGARVSLDFGGRSVMRDVRSGFSYLAANDARVHFGLGAAAGVQNVRVQWTDGTEELFGEFGAGAIVALRKGAGTR
jgi:hypothetical protein